MARLWEHQKKESAKAYRAFCLYRDFGHERSIRKVLQAENKKRTNLGVWGRWSNQHNWPARAQAYDDHLEAESRRQFEKEHFAMVRRHARQSMMLQSKSLEKLQATPAESLTVNQALDFMTEGIRMERQSRGDSTDSIEISDSHDMSNEQRIERIGKLLGKAKKVKAEGSE